MGGRRKSPHELAHRIVKEPGRYGDRAMKWTAPEWFSPEQRAQWERLATEFPFIDPTFRMQVEELARLMALPAKNSTQTEIIDRTLRQLRKAVGADRAADETARKPGPYSQWNPTPDELWPTGFRASDRYEEILGLMTSANTRRDYDLVEKLRVELQAEAAICRQKKTAGIAASGP